MIRLIALSIVISCAVPASAKEPIPDKLVVLTFDDSVRSQFTQVRPILKQYKFGATFFVTEGFDFKKNKKDYMTWEQIGQLHRDGFEIGNHTRDHMGVSEKTLNRLEEQVTAIAERCKQHGIPKPTSFAYPGNAYHLKGLEILRGLGIRFARRGGTPEYPYKDGQGVAYEPGLDHPLLIPSAGDARPNWTLDNFIAAAKQARHGRIAVLQFHGVPDNAHPWVNTGLDQFKAFMRYLAVEKYKVIAMRDLAKYVDHTILPHDATMVLGDRAKAKAAKTARTNYRKPQSEAELKYWLENMMTHHGFSRFEVSSATGLAPEDVARAEKQFGIKPQSEGSRQDEAKRLRVLPYPGGRHPRIGFLDGAIRPQRETKISVFTPWDSQGYVVADVPEAIWNGARAERELLYLAHTHVPTAWDRQNIQLKPLEWKRLPNGVLEVERVLPNKVSFGARVTPLKDGVSMEMWLSNHSKSTLTGLRVQNCVMLKAAKEFRQLTNDNKLLSKPFAACRDESGRRWVITGWERCTRPWGNVSCPCLHADPQFEDCPPGVTRRLRGWLSFYEGKDIEQELDRLRKKLPWAKP